MFSFVCPRSTSHQAPLPHSFAFLFFSIFFSFCSPHVEAHQLSFLWLRRLLWYVVVVTLGRGKVVDRCVGPIRMREQKG
ncbi:hypothetical protein DFJ73DRAFT_857807 [Zopfochytrium polystomum]|nr:hypothetical protein DFJ73DRAFT_857807 [Zopfochytrium polystomum]